MPGLSQPPTGASSSLDVWIAVSEIARNWGLLGAAGVAGTFGLWLAWRRTRAADLQAAVAAKRQVTEAFTATISQLGYEHNDLEVRLGAIYALGQIAKSSPEHHWPIMETLTAYVREHLIAPPDDAKREPEPPPPDIRAIISVLLDRRAERETTTQRLDLARTKLTKVNLRDANFDRANLSKADLRESNLRGANLRGASFYRADLRDADIPYAYLRGAKFERANLKGAIFFKSDLSGADLQGANLSEAILEAAVLTNAILTGAILTGTNLNQATFDNTVMPDGDTYTGTGPPPGWDSTD